MAAGGISKHGLNRSQWKVPAQGYRRVSITPMPVLPKPRDEKLAQNLARGDMTIRAAFTGAGFSYDPSRATKHCQQPHIQARVLELRETRAKKTMEMEVETSAAVAKKLGITKEAIIQRLWYNAERCLRGQPLLDANGVQTGKFSGRPDAAGAAQSLRLVGMECFGMFVERQEIGGPGDFSRLTDEELTKRALDDAAALGLPAEATEALLLTFQGTDGTENND